MKPPKSIRSVAVALSSSIVAGASGLFVPQWGDFTVGRQQATSLELRRWDHLPAPKRGLRLSRLTLNNVETIVLTTRSGWPFARYCARHSTELPAPLGLTSSVPV